MENGKMNKSTLLPAISGLIIGFAIAAPAGYFYGQETEPEDLRRLYTELRAYDSQLEMNKEFIDALSHVEEERKKQQ